MQLPHPAISGVSPPFPAAQTLRCHHFYGFLPSREDFAGRRAGECKDFVLSSLRASSFLLSAAAEHFPAEHEAMRLMSPICDSLSHPLPGGQHCLCLHGLKAVREGGHSGLQVCTQPFCVVLVGQKTHQSILLLRGWLSVSWNVIFLN